jgi:RNase P protein component
MINTKLSRTNNNRLIVMDDNNNTAYFRDNSLLGSSVKKGIQYGIDDTEIVGGSFTRHRYSRLGKSSYD